MNGTEVYDEMEPDHLRAHIRHCFDLLRQSLMCCGDASLEPYDSSLGGVTGWGFPKLCRDYDELKEWAERYRTNDL